MLNNTLIVIAVMAIIVVAVALASMPKSDRQNWHKRRLQSRNKKRKWKRADVWEKL